MSQFWEATQKFFRQEPEEKEDPSVDLTDCHEAVDFGRHMHLKNWLMPYLDRGADSMLDLKDGTTMLTSAARVNAFKEIKAEIKRHIRDAQEVIDRETSGD